MSPASNDASPPRPIHFWALGIALVSGILVGLSVFTIR